MGSAAPFCIITFSRNNEIKSKWKYIHLLPILIPTLHSPLFVVQKIITRLHDNSDRSNTRRVRPIEKLSALQSWKHYGQRGIPSCLIMILLESMIFIVLSNLSRLIILFYTIRTKIEKGTSKSKKGIS